MLSTSSYKIHTYNNNYCLNDAVIQCDISTNPKEYIGAIADKITYNSQFYVPKDKLCEILSKSKVYKSKQLLKYLQDANTLKEKLEIVELTNKTNELINFVNYKESIIQFNNKPLKYFIYNEQFYFKAKDVAEILEYTNTKQAIILHVDDLDKFNLYNLLLNEEVRGVYNIDPPQTLEKGGFEKIISMPLTGTLENNKTKIDPNKLKNISDIYNKIKNEDLQTIFINEGGFYSLIMSSKKAEAKVFKRWVTSEVLPSIRKNGAYISNKLIEYNKDEFKNYYNKDCVYILHIKDNIYKYGKTSDIQDRFYRHKRNLGFTNIEKIYVLSSINEINAMEDDIKEFTKNNKINLYYNHGIEFFECTSTFSLNKIIETINNIYKKIKKNTNSTDILLGKMMNKLEKLDSIDIRLTELENLGKNTNEINNVSSSNILLKKILIKLDKLDNIDMRLSKLENLDKNITNKTIPVAPTISKCIDCLKDTTSKFAVRCGTCEKNNRLKVAMEDGTKPSQAQLQKDLAELRYISQVAKKYNVTSRTITKWFANYEKYNQQNKIDPPQPEEPKKQPDKPKNKIPQLEEQKKTATQPIIPKEDEPYDPKKKKCMDCDKLVYKNCTRCLKCMNKNKIKTNAITMNRPSLDQLKNDLKELKSMVQVGVKYKVSDNAIRKWIKNYEKII